MKAHIMALATWVAPKRELVTLKVTNSLNEYLYSLTMT
jgi:hypothetical protein